MNIYCRITIPLLDKEQYLQMVNAPNSQEISKIKLCFLERLWSIEIWPVLVLSYREVFRTQPNIDDGAFL